MQGIIINGRGGVNGRDIVQKDPVCGMMVDEKTAKLKSEHEGKTFYFCGPGCKATFDKDPHKFAHRM